MPRRIFEPTTECSSGVMVYVTQPLRSPNSRTYFLCIHYYNTKFSCKFFRFSRRLLIIWWPSVRFLYRVVDVCSDSSQGRTASNLQGQMEAVGSSETSQHTSNTERINPKGIYLNYFHVMMGVESVSERQRKKVTQPLNRKWGLQKVEAPRLQDNPQPLNRNWGLQSALGGDKVGPTHRPPLTPPGDNSGTHVC
jgi:hypothetical protein